MNDFQKDFGHFLKMARKKVGLSQEKAGEAIGVTKNTIGKWENEGTKPDNIHFKKIINTYNLSREDFLEKYNNLALPKTETEDLEKKERKYPWPDCMPLEKWIDTCTLEDLKNLQLNELETELLGLMEFYHLKGEIGLDKRNVISSINFHFSNENNNGTFDFSAIPYEFIKTYGVFNVNNAKHKLCRLGKLVYIVTSYFMECTNNKTFDICDLTPRDFYDFSMYIPVRCFSRTQKKFNYLNHYLNNIRDILYLLEKYNNKYCLFDGSQFTEFECENGKWEYKKTHGDLIFVSSLYDIHIPTPDENCKINDMNVYRHIYLEPLHIYEDLIEVVEEPIMSNLEYLEYQNKLEFYEKNKDKGAIKPQEPTEMGLYVVPTEKGKELLKWFKEIGILKD